MTETAEQAYARGIADALALVDDVRALVPTLMPESGHRLTLAELAQAIATYGVDRLDVLRPYDVREAISLKAACRIAGRSPSALRDWCEKYAIGRNVVGSLMVSGPALLMLLDGDTLALAALLAGRRDHPAVAPYLERAGLPIAA